MSPTEASKNSPSRISPVAGLRPRMSARAIPDGSGGGADRRLTRRLHSFGIWLRHRRSARHTGLDRAPDPSLAPAPAARGSSLRETPRAANESRSSPYGSTSRRLQWQLFELRLHRRRQTLGP